MTSARVTDSDLRNVFEVFDTDGTGSIDAEELLHALRALGWNKATAADITKIMAHIGKDSRGEALDFDEFCDVVKSKQRIPDGPEEIMAAFRLFDVENKGRLNFADLQAAGERATGKPVAEKLVGQILELADKDKDGFLSFEEFRAAVSKYEGGDLEATGAFAGTASSEQLNDQVARDEAEDQKDSEAAAQLAASDSKQEVIAGVKVSFIAEKIAKAEVRRALAELGYDEATMPDNVYDDLFSDSDADSDGLLTMDEYCLFLVSLGEQVDGY